jgi:hypothetical protein
MRAVGQRSRVLVTAGILVAAMSMGCTVMTDEDNELDYTPTVKSVDDGRAETRDVSSRILDLAGIQGEVSEPGPGVSTCDADPDMEENLYIIRHPWSIYGLPAEKLEEGMSNLRRELPRRGWEILEEGELNNTARSPRILFENRDVEYAANVVLRGKDTNEPMLEVTVVSACFRTPEGESPRGQY